MTICNLEIEIFLRYVGIGRVKKRDFVVLFLVLETDNVVLFFIWVMDGKILRVF